MSSDAMYVQALRMSEAEGEVHGDFVTLGGEPFYRIANYDRMDPFFMSVVSASDHWMFISSNGGLTAGRRNADHALFPYETVDRIHDSADHTGPKTILRVVEQGRRLLWEPFSRRYEGLYRVSRHLYKNVYGNTLVFEEVNHDLALAFRYRWSPSERFGFVRRAELENRGEAAVSVEVLDGIQNLLPWGIADGFQRLFSVLGDAHKQNELDGATGLATFALSSVPGDSTEPAESLRATVCWSTLPSAAARLLSSRQVDTFRRGGEVRGETRVCGRRGAYFVRAQVDLRAGGSRDWLLVTDLGYGPSEIARLRRTVVDEEVRRSAVLDDVAASTVRLAKIVGGADGLQRTGDHLGSVHHFANVLFNVMRGGTFESVYDIDVADLEAHVRSFNRVVWKEHAAFFAALGEKVELGLALEAAEGVGDPALLRLVTEYLPLSFSRRHGDPSRPWNRFSIELRDRDGSRRLGYQGNWRDIFQNWEALCLSFPQYLDGVIGKFLNTSTADGYNPYRVHREGYDWERPSPDEPWANLGYWGDHQLIYLLKLLEWSRAHHPGRLERLLRAPRFVYADVPYDLRPYEELLADPRHAIEYNRAREVRIEERVEAIGFDGRYLAGEEGDLHGANLTEKLLVPLLAKLGSFAPGAGFWLNTQRPEWNDANNALAGYGASMVTVYYARRYVAFCLDLFEALGDGAVEMHDEVAVWLERSQCALLDHDGLLDASRITDSTRKTVLDTLGNAAGDYRAGLYTRGLGGEVRAVGAETLRDFLRSTLRFLDHSIESNRREDGLYHAYNILDIADDGIAVKPLYPMLEGQVAALSSGALEPREAVSLLDALRRSEMYRADQHSYMLYPDRELPGFLEKNIIPETRVAGSELLIKLLADGDTTVVERDIDGVVHFNPAFQNAGDVRRALDALRAEWAPELVARESELIGEIFESVFDHARFTGRSGTFYGYEGLGSIYWHMVSKLLLAVQEVAARAASEDPDAFQALAARYYDVRAGLGFNKAPEVFGAFPTDPYSHTPANAGAKQPGMTGQVKEEVITRLGELGLWVSEGRVRFDPLLLRRSEFLETPETFRYYDVDGAEASVALEPHSLAFTYCQVPVVYRMAEEEGLTLHLADGSSRSLDGLTLDREASAELFRRTGAIQRVEVTLRPGLGEPLEAPA
ncbi:MAG: hypothetical protein JSU98_02065 [Gemmatimonadales bacterium]|nr:MAG: hypothetical protein JSU98_02065 [Gemmatimonadales bacterium]